jgi:inactivated superfamily I helicase
MEIREIVSYYINNAAETLEVSFRTLDDEDNQLRNDEIPIVEITAFGYDIIKSDSEFLDDFEEEDDDFFESFLSDNLDYIDHQELLAFLNEYYTIYQDKLPKSELF